MPCTFARRNSLSGTKICMGFTQRNHRKIEVTVNDSSLAQNSKEMLPQ